jgi:uncharacterized phage protein (predicted DNA packaging)
MAVDIDDLKAQLVVEGSDDDGILARLLTAATYFVQSQIGFAIDDAAEFPDGTPADLEHAILMIAASWFENREAVISGTIIASVPMGVDEIVANYRRYSFGAADE